MAGRKRTATTGKLAQATEFVESVNAATTAASVKPTNADGITVYQLSEYSFTPTDNGKIMFQSPILGDEKPFIQLNSILKAIHIYDSALFVELKAYNAAINSAYASGMNIPDSDKGERFIKMAMKQQRAIFRFIYTLFEIDAGNKPVNISNLTIVRKESDEVNAEGVHYANWHIAGFEYDKAKIAKLFADICD